MENVVVSWSGGKDSAIALYEILKSQNYQISALLTTVTEGYDQISMHGVRRIVLERQVASWAFRLKKCSFHRTPRTKNMKRTCDECLQNIRMQA